MRAYNGEQMEKRGEEKGLKMDVDFKLQARKKHHKQDEWICI